ncbi:beta-galactosidase, partial [bacterium]|nr:beta-galactosidase [bacterium]
MRVEFDKYSLIVDGKRIVLRCGSIHYFRTLGEEEWYDRLSKMKAGGYNAVDIYFYWGFHEEKKGIYDFEGYKNVEKLLEIAQNLGLFVVARPGPFINAEVSAGGIPYWLLKEKDVVLRNRDNGNYIYSPKYMEEVKKWYAKIVPIINKFDNVILFQIENEYSTNGGEEEYIKELYDYSKELGVKAPIFHNDAYIAGLYSNVVDIYACDLYPYINPKANWREDLYTLDTLDNLEDMTSYFKDCAPTYIAELQSGWYDKWLGVGYDEIREDMGSEHINIMTKTALAQGITAYNHYMTIGGTNIENTSSDEVYTSYDFAAPISELGIIKDNFKKAKEINYFLESFNLAHTERVDDAPNTPDNSKHWIRYDSENNCKWHFVRNLNFAQTRVGNFNLDPFEMKILPENLKLAACEIISSGLEIFTRLINGSQETIFLISDYKNSIEIKDNTGEIHKISGDKEDFEEITFESTKFIFASHQTYEKAWKIGDEIIFGAEFVYPNGKIATNSASEIKTYSIEKGWNTKCLEHTTLPTKIKLTDFEVAFSAPELEDNYDYSNWKKVEQNEDGSLKDAFALDVYSEFIWYKGKISNKVKEISI